MTSLYTMTGGIMDLHPAAGRRSHRRLIVVLLALAVCVMLGVTAPQALAGPMGAHSGYRPWIMIKASPATWGSKLAIKVSGEAWPIEIVGEYLLLSVQRKAPSGKWLTVGSGHRQVQFIPPDSWDGTFDTTIDWLGSFTGINPAWKGSVSYGSPETHQIEHYVDYSMTSALGTLWADGIFGSGRTLKYTAETPLEDSGTLRWYFADILGDYGSDGKLSVLIPKGSYEGDSYHKTRGTLTEVEDGVTLPVDHAFVVVVEDVLRLKNTEPRPVLNTYGQMQEKRVVINDADPTQIETTTSQWSLAPSSAVENGFYTWGYKTAKKGVYRVRATVAKTRDHAAAQSVWIKVRLR
jgi:hypothetical protein